MTRDGTVGRFRRNREKPAASSGHRSRSNDEDSVRGPHQGQQSTRTAPTGRTHDCKRPLRCTPNDLLPGGGHPHMKRREFITLLGGAAAACPLSARAQQPRKIYRVGLLVSGAPMGATDKRQQTFLSALTAHGFVDGQNLVFVQRSADARPERLDGLAAELKAANVDVIVTFGYPAALAAKKSTRDIPIVISAAGDPVATGLVDGVARPGGNITGVTELSTELSAKRLEILRDAVPTLTRVAMLWNADDLGMTLRYRAAEDAASLLGIKVQTLGVREPDDFEHAFAEMTRERPDAILMVSD